MVMVVMMMVMMVILRKLQPNSRLPSLSCVFGS